MSQSLGSKIAEYRKNLGMTQDELAEKLGVTPQAVSKWENDISCPDIMLLPKIAQLLGTTCDELLSNEPKKDAVLLPAEKRRDIDEMVMHISVISDNGDKVIVNLPVSLIKAALEIGMNIPEISVGDAVKNIDFSQIFAVIERGVIGKLVEIESANGDRVEISVE